MLTLPSSDISAHLLRASDSTGHADSSALRAMDREPHQRLLALQSPTYGTEEGRPVTFKRELLNTCQDQFEGMEQQRAGLASNPMDEQGKFKLRMRELGTVRLLGELFNKARSICKVAAFCVAVAALAISSCVSAQPAMSHMQSSDPCTGASWNAVSRHCT